MLELRELTVIYPDKTKALDCLSLIVGRGENVALIGENGAGKTTLLLAAVGIIEASRGSVEVDGVVLGKKTVSEVRARIGLVFQNPDDQLFMPYIYDDVAFGCRNMGLSEAAVRERVEGTLERLGISHLKGRSSLRLSGGEKRMAAIATALAMQPGVLMLDEPTAFLDPKARRALIGALKSLDHAKVITTHDMAFAAELCERVVVLKDGRVAADSDRSLLYNQKLMLDCGLEALG